MSKWVSKFAGDGACVVCGEATPSWYYANGGKALRKTCSAECLKIFRADVIGFGAENLRHRAVSRSVRPRAAEVHG